MSNFLFPLNVAMSFVHKVQKMLEVDSGNVLPGAWLKKQSPHFDVTIHTGTAEHYQREFRNVLEKYFLRSLDMKPPNSIDLNPLD